MILDEQIAKFIVTICIGFGYQLRPICHILEVHLAQTNNSFYQVDMPKSAESQQEFTTNIILLVLCNLRHDTIRRYDHWGHIHTFDVEIDSAMREIDEVFED